MSGKTAAGIVLMIVGTGTVLYALSYMNSFGVRLGRELGQQDNTGFILGSVGGAIVAVGLVLSVAGYRKPA